jgi:hypothetical protein
MSRTAKVFMPARMAECWAETADAKTSVIAAAVRTRGDDVMPHAWPWNVPGPSGPRHRLARATLGWVVRMGRVAAGPMASSRRAG